MKQRVGPVMRLASPLKAWVQRFAFLMLVAAAVSLLVVGRTNLDAVSQARSAVTDAITPILALLTRPTDVMVEAIDSVRELGDLRAENARLREERARLLHWQSAARQLDAENRELRALLKGAGVDGTRPAIASCGSGVTAAVLAFGLYLIGRTDVAVYDGSWSEWGGRSDVPVES